VVVDRHTKVNFILLILGEFESMGVGILVAHENEITCRRVGCYRQHIVLVVVPTCIDLVDGRFIAPTIAIIRHLYCSMGGLLELITKTISCTLVSYPSRHPSLYSIHLELDGSFFVADTGLNEGQQGILVVWQVRHHHIFAVCHFEIGME
jgi:hypothetical protein